MADRKHKKKKNMPDILLVDDHSIVRTGLKLLIQDFLAHANIDEATTEILL